MTGCCQSLPSLRFFSVHEGQVRRESTSLSPGAGLTEVTSREAGREAAWAGLPAPEGRLSGASSPFPGPLLQLSRAADLSWACRERGGSDARGGGRVGRVVLRGGRGRVCSSNRVRLGWGRGPSSQGDPARAAPARLPGPLRSPALPGTPARPPPESGKVGGGGEME